MTSPAIGVDDAETSDRGIVSRRTLMKVAAVVGAVALLPAAAFADDEPDPTALPDYAPVPRSAFGPALNVKRNLYWVTD